MTITVTLTVTGNRGEGKTTLINKIRPLIIAEMTKLPGCADGKLTCRESQTNLVMTSTPFIKDKAASVSLSVKQGWKKRKANAMKEGWNPAKGRKSRGHNDL